MKYSFFKYLLVYLAATAIIPTHAQWQRATLGEDYLIRTEQFSAPPAVTRRSDVQQLSGFPKVLEANPTFKNFRNITLHDVDGDGLEDILWSTNQSFQVWSVSGLLWERELTGVGIYPPSIGNVVGDQAPEIVLTTGGTDGAKLYVWDLAGNAQTGFPKSFDNHWLLLAPTLANVDVDEELEIIVNERLAPTGLVHILNGDGTNWSNDWPVLLDKTPATTPTVGDVDNDGAVEVVIWSTESRHVLNLDGAHQAGWPLNDHPRTRFSYHSPVLVDFDNNGTLEIVGSTTGDLPEYFVLQHDGSYYADWPVLVPDANWTFSPPTVVEQNGVYEIYMSRPVGGSFTGVVYGFQPDAQSLPNFPIRKNGGLEGVISVVNLDDDPAMEFLFGSNTLDDNGRGFIHAYDDDGQTELPNFPLQTTGFTFMNGASVTDFDGNGTMDVVALSYTSNFGAAVDSVYLNVFDLQISYSPERIKWNTYKGSNDRAGIVANLFPTSIENQLELLNSTKIFPNPVFDHLFLQNSTDVAWKNYQVLDIYGRVHYQKELVGDKLPSSIDVSSLSSGIYFLQLTELHGGRQIFKFLKQ